MSKEFKDSRFLMWLAVLGSVGCFCVLLISRKWGLGVTAESMSYVQAARNFVAGVGFGVFSKSGMLEPLVSYPPGFPFVLSWGWFLGMDAFHWARILNAVFFGLNIFLAGILAWSWSKNKIAGLIAAGLFLFSPQLLEIHLQLLSEPVALASLLIFFIALRRYEDDGGKGMFYAAACSAAVAGLMRPVEMAFVVTAWVVFFSTKGDGFNAKTLKAGFFLILAAAFPIVWCVRNILLGGPIVGAHPFSLEKMYVCFDALSIWFLPRIVPEVVRWVVMGFLVSGLVALWRGRKKVAGENVTPLSGMSAPFIFMFFYFLSCLFVVSFFSAADMSGNTLLSPILALLLVVLACLVVRADLKKVIVGAAILFVLFSCVRSVNLAIAFFKNGDGYSSRAWTESKVLRELRAVDERVTVYANDPAAIYYLIGRPAIRIPAKNEDDGFFPSTVIASRMFEGREAVGIVFNEKAFISGPQWTQLKTAAALKNVMSDGLASIYVQKKKAKAADKAPKK